MAVIRHGEGSFACLSSVFGINNKGRQRQRQVAGIPPTLQQAQEADSNAVFHVQGLLWRRRGINTSLMSSGALSTPSRSCASSLFFT